MQRPGGSQNPVHSQHVQLQVLWGDSGWIAQPVLVKPVTRRYFRPVPDVFKTGCFGLSLDKVPGMFACKPKCQVNARSEVMAEVRWRSATSSSSKAHLSQTTWHAENDGAERHNGTQSQSKLQYPFPGPCLRKADATIKRYSLST